MPRKRESKKKRRTSTRRKPTRAPVNVILKLQQTLAGNDGHPLGRMDAQRRGIDRQHVIAKILARIADGESRDREEMDIIEENS